jgi:hypothetical protein
VDGFWTEYDIRVELERTIKDENITVEATIDQTFQLNQN